VALEADFGIQDLVIPRAGGHYQAPRDLSRPTYLRLRYCERWPRWPDFRASSHSPAI